MKANIWAKTNGLRDALILTTIREKVTLSFSKHKLKCKHNLMSMGNLTELTCKSGEQKGGCWKWGGGETGGDGKE